MNVHMPHEWQLQQLLLLLLPLQVAGCKLQMSPAGAIGNKRKSVNHREDGQVQSSMDEATKAKRRAAATC